ncbi:MAG: hypothetical protein A4E37_00083 [Methanoregulaceae archaeon PtaB.Bin056]|nr:MAG: hypothetical protein A4E37_00083 [Methanoregulaceae archaeon PtaB.Bin056]
MAGPDDCLRPAVHLGDQPEPGKAAALEDAKDLRQVELRAVGDQVATRDQDPAGMAGEHLVGCGV